MSVTRAEKEKEIEELKSIFGQDELVVLTHNEGLTVKQMTELRMKLRTEGARYKIAKNTLARRALEGTKFAHLAPKFTGPTGVASSKDPMAAARVIYAFAKDNEKLKILGGAAGAEALDLEKIKFLALLPSLDALRGKIVGILQAPAAQIARVVNAYATKAQ